MNIDKNKFIFKKLDTSYTDSILLLQKQTIEKLSDKDLLRENTREMIEECLTGKHYAIGVFYDENFVGYAVLYFPYTDEEDLSVYLDDKDRAGVKSANYKVVVIDENYRGNGLQGKLGLMLEEYAKERGVNTMLATASPKNIASNKGLKRIGYKIYKEIEKYGFKRNLLYKKI